MQDQARHFLFLQGPHGPFFARLAGHLPAKGHRVTRIGLNAADRIFWPWRFTYQAFKGRDQPRACCRHAGQWAGGTAICALAPLGQATRLGRLAAI